MYLAADRGVAIRRAAPLMLMPAAAFAVHQLRYWLAFGGHAGAQLAAQGHSYLHSLVPWLVLLIAGSAGIFVRALGQAWAGQRSLPRYTASFTALWLLCAACLVTIFVTQEFLEGMLAAGHPAGLAGIFGSGGWWAIPAALAVGLVLAALFHGAQLALVVAAAAHPARRTRPLRPPRLPRSLLLPRLAPLAGGWSGRGPPH